MVGGRWVTDPWENRVQQDWYGRKDLSMSLNRHIPAFPLIGGAELGIKSVAAPDPVAEVLQSAGSGI